MKKKQHLHASLFLWCLFWVCPALFAQSFTDIPGPMGTARCLLKGSDGAVYMGTSTKGVYRSVDGGQNWVGLGGNTIMTGRINALAYDANGQLIAATEQGGVKTWNGTAWLNVNTGLFSGCGLPIPIRTIALTPDGTLYAGAHGYSACFPQGDLYRYDGSSWVSIAAGMGNTNINSLAVHPVSGALFAGTDGGVFQYDGTSWTVLNNGLNDTVIHKLVFAPNGDLFAGASTGVAVLGANAFSWSNLSTGLNGLPVHAIALDQNPAHMLIGAGYSIERVGGLYGQLFETQDAGLHWTNVSGNIETTVIHDVAFTGNQHCLAVGWGAFKSSDNGQNWTPSNSGFSGKTFNTQGRVAVSPAPGHNLFYGTDDGLFRSTDNGVTWTMASRGLTRHMVTLLQADRQGNLFCGVMRYLGENSVGFGDGLLYKSSDNGDNWQPVSISKDWRYLEMSELANGDLICSHGFGAQPPSATIIGSSLSRSSDHGDTWVDLDVHAGLGYSCAANAAGDLFTAGESQSVYRSTDGGNSFELIVAPGQSGNVGILEISPTGDILMGSGGVRTLFFSLDNGTNYSTFNSPVLPDYRGVNDVTFDHLGKAFCSTTGQNGIPALFTIEPPFTVNSTFSPLPGVSGPLFKMTWDDCGYLYIYRAGGILKSSAPLRPPAATCISSISDAAPKQTDFSIYPNPVTDKLFIQMDRQRTSHFSLWNMTGQKLREMAANSPNYMDMAALPNGVYFLKATDTNGAENVFKILKQ